MSIRLEIRADFMQHSVAATSSSTAALSSPHERPLMRRILAPLTLAAAVAVALTGCVVLPFGAPYGSGWVELEPAYGPAYDPTDDGFDPAEEERWQQENIAMELEFAETVAEQLRAAGSQLPPAEGESLEAFRHLAVGVGYEWCDRLFIDETRQGDATEHAEQAERYGWETEEYRIVAEHAQEALCGY